MYKGIYVYMYICIEVKGVYRCKKVYIGVDRCIQAYIGVYVYRSICIKVQKASPWRPGFVWFVKSSHSSYFCLPA